MHLLQAGEHVHCLDVLKVAFPAAPDRMSHDCAILLEIWDGGALLQTSIAIPEGQSICFESIGEGVPAKVISCEQDSYGFMVQVEVGETQWFPKGYTPPHVMWPGLPS